MIEKEVALTNPVKTIVFTKKWYVINSTIAQPKWIVLVKQIFEIETGMLLVENPSEKWVVTFVFYLFDFASVVAVFVCLYVCFSQLIFLSSLTFLKLL